MVGKEIGLDTCIKRAGGLVSTRVDEDVVLMSIASGKYYGMDAIGSRIWDILEKPVKVAVIVETLMAEYNVDQKRCEEDVLAFLNKMLGKTIILE